MFDYREDMKEAIRNYISDNGIDTFNNLYDDMWEDDSITNNMSAYGGSEEREHVLDNMDILMDACREFGVDYETLGRKFAESDYGYFDATIRTYLLGECLQEVLDEMGQEED